MAQAYDIYLHKRLTEFNLIIKNLVLRDGLVVHTKMYLDAMVNYLCLQKFIVGRHNTQLQAEIDTLLKQVFNAFHHVSVLGFYADAMANKPISGAAAMCLDVNQLPVTEECFNTFTEYMTLSTKVLTYEVAKSLGAGHSGLVLDTTKIKTVKESFERMLNQFDLSVKADPSSEKFTQADIHMNLQTDSFDIFYLLTIECEAWMNLLCAADTELWYTLGEANGQITLTVHNDMIQSEKFCDISVFQKILSAVNVVLTYFIIPDGLTAYLAASVSAGLRRYRKISEVDPLTLGSMDEMTLEDLDYVVLA